MSRSNIAVACLDCDVHVLTDLRISFEKYVENFLIAPMANSELRYNVSLYHINISCRISYTSTTCAQVFRVTPAFTVIVKIPLVALVVITAYRQDWSLTTRGHNDRNFSYTSSLYQDCFLSALNALPNKNFVHHTFN